MSDLTLMRSPIVCRWMVIVMLLSLATAPLAAQTFFQWSSTPIDVAKYTTPEQCLRFIERLRDSVVFANDRIDRDTLPVTLMEVRASPDASLIQAAARCSAKYVPDNVAPQDLIPVLQLYLIAERDADAYVLVTHVLASSTADGEAHRVAILADIIREYINTQPARLSAAAQFLDMIAEGSTEVGMRQRLGTLHAFLNAARRGQDTARIRYAANVLLELAHRGKDQLSGELEGGYVLSAREALATDTLLDSLRRSAAAYVAMHRGLQTQAGVTRAIGKVAPRLGGDYWFVSPGFDGRSGAATPPVRPASGKVSVVVFLEPWHVPQGLVPNYDAVGVEVRGSLATIRRLSSRYPDLDVTGVTNTHGVFQRMQPLDRDAEADTLRRYWLEFWRFPGTLVIERTPFSRLPDPDRRVFEENGDNVENYNFGERQKATRMWTFIVDRDGTIVWYGKMERETEAVMDRIIGILLHRNASGV